jgi:hypothetical protein
MTKPTKQTSLDFIVINYGDRIKKLEDLLRSFGLVELALAQSPTTPGETVIWTGTEWIPIEPPWIELGAPPTAPGEIIVWNGSEWLPSAVPEDDDSAYLALGQIPNTTGQIPVWNGTMWLPEMPAPTSGGETIALNVLNHGVMGDGAFFQGSMTAGSNVLTASTPIFVATDVGKIVSVAYALSTADGDGNTLSAHITAVNSATQVVLSVTADTNTGSNTDCFYSTDDAPALATLSQLSPWSLFLPGGHIYGFGQSCPISCEVFGAGAQTVVLSTVFQDVFVLIPTSKYVFAPDVQLHDLSICTTLNWTNNINSGASAYPNLYSKSQFAVVINGPTVDIPGTGETYAEFNVGGNWDVQIPQYRVYNIHSGFGFGAYVSNPFGATSGPNILVQPCYQGISVGETPPSYKKTGGGGYIAGVAVDNWSIVTQAGHCIWVCGGADQWHGDTYIGANVWCYNLGNTYVDGVNSFYDPLCQIVQCDHCTLDNVIQTENAAAGHGLVIGGGAGIVTGINKVTVNNCFFNDVLIVLDVGLASNYPTNQYAARIEEVVINNTDQLFIDVEGNYPATGHTWTDQHWASLDYGQSFMIVAKNLAGTNKHSLDSVKATNFRVAGNVDVDLDPAVVQRVTLNTAPDTQPEINLDGITVFTARYYYASPMLDANGTIQIHPNTQHFRIMRCDVQGGIVVQTGSSDDYMIAYNDTHGTGVTDGGTGTHKIVGNNL